MKPMLSIEEFRKYAKEFNVIPVATSYLADNETPLTIYTKLCNARENTVLLESA